MNPICHSSPQVLSALSAALCALLFPLGAQAQITNYPAGTRAVMVNTNGVLVAPTNFWQANFRGLAGQAPTWSADVTNEAANSFLVYSDTMDGQIQALGDNKALITAGLLGSASSNATADFARSTNATVVGSLGVTGTGTFARVHGTNLLYSRAGNAWPRTRIVSVPYYSSAGPSAPGEFSSWGSALSSEIIPFGMYTNIARLAVSMSFLTNATCSALYATNFKIGIYSYQAEGLAFSLNSSGSITYPTNNGSWTFFVDGLYGCAATTGLVVNIPVGAPTKSDLLLRPVIFFYNHGAYNITNGMGQAVIEYDNGSAD